MNLVFTGGILEVKYDDFYIYKLLFLQYLLKSKCALLIHYNVDYNISLRLNLWLLFFWLGDRTKENFKRKYILMSKNISVWRKRWQKKIPKGNPSH